MHESVYRYMIICKYINIYLCIQSIHMYIKGRGERGMHNDKLKNETVCSLTNI